jgi:hypothetical protein
MQIRILKSVLLSTDSDADLGGPKTYGSVSGTMVKSQKEVKKQ